MSKLALLGGNPVLAQPLRPYASMGEAELAAVTRVMRSGRISGFYGSPGPEFLGGPVVRQFEAAWQAEYGARHVVSVNSATSGLMAAMAAIGVSPGDEVIVPPYTMSATAMAPLLYGGIPVFADIEPQTFCIDVAAVQRAITPKTRAIIAVNLFGHPARLAELRALADAKGLFLIEDSAQAPLATENGKRAGCIGHIGVYSLNFHKHIHTGEGGMCVTEDDDLALRLRMVRNHAENIVEHERLADITNMIGFNFRLTELGAAIGIEQLRRIDEHVAAREALAVRLSEGVRGLTGLTAPVVRADCRHNYYCWTLRYDAKKIGVDRATFSEALTAEGFPHFVGYTRPLYLLPVFQRRHAIGRQGFPFNLSDRSYAAGLCPVAERMHTEETILFEPCAYQVDAPTVDLLVEALRKVHAQAAALAGSARRKVAQA